MACMGKYTNFPAVYPTFLFFYGDRKLKTLNGKLRFPTFVMPLKVQVENSPESSS